ncbi:hypothetical protein L0128_07185, partial [candidate division KSB1 bacterium]|nr:hypothetical protein [candidate division KSB1 bacterium]
NRKALDVAQKHQLPMVGCSDAHFKHQFGTTYSYVYAAEKSIPAIIAAIKAGKVEYVSTPLPFYRVCWISIWALFKLPYYLRNFVRKMSLKFNVKPYRIRRLVYQLFSPLLWPEETVRPARLHLKSGLHP